jgi:hypothetical protein
MAGQADDFFAIAQLLAQLLNILIQLEQQVASSIVRDHALRPEK